MRSEMAAANYLCYWDGAPPVLIFKYFFDEHAIWDFTIHWWDQTAVDSIELVVTTDGVSKAKGLWTQITPEYFSEGNKELMKLSFCSLWSESKTSFPRGQ